MSAVACDLRSEQAGAPRPCLRLVDHPGPGRTRPPPCVPASVHRRRRVGAAGAVVAAGLAMALALAPAVGAPATQVPPSAAAHPAEPARIVVGPGDTIWDLAAPHAPAGTDAMAYVVEVAALNDVDPRAVRPGTVLRLPAAAD